MKRSNVIILVVVLVLAAIVVAVIMGGDKKKDTSNNAGSSANNNSAQSSDTNNTANNAATDQVTIQNFAFSPQTITVKAGTKVTWTNKDSVSHTVTADQASSDAPDSGSIAQNETFSFTFTKAGTYAYHCKPHPSMQATVIVTE